jgi:hypothetical protein
MKSPNRGVLTIEMLTPKVTEIRRPLEAVTQDSFVVTSPSAAATTQTPRRA